MATTRYIWASSAQDDGDATWNSSTLAFLTTAAAVSASSAGDICLMHVGVTARHVETDSSSSISVPGPTSGDPVTIIGVDKDNSDAFLKSAAANVITDTLTTIDINLQNRLAVYGIWFKSSDLIDCQGGNDDYQSYHHCTFEFSNSSNYVFSPSNGIYNFCDFILLSGNISISDTCAGYIGCTYTSTASNGLFQGANAVSEVIGTTFVATATEITNSYYMQRLNIVGCVLHATELISKSGANMTDVRVSGSDSVAGNSQWRTEHIQATTGILGKLSLRDTIYRDGTSGYDGTNEYSFLYEAGSDPHLDHPTYTDWNSKYVASGDGQNIKVYIAATASQDDAEVWVEVEYFSSVDNTLKIVASSRIETLLDAPVANETASGETWAVIAEVPTGGQYLTLPANIDIKKSGMLRWRVGFASADDVYLDMEPDII